MAKDRRIWIKLATQMPDSPKIEILSDAAFRAYVEMLCYSRENLTDGFIHERVVARRWRGEVIDELCSNSGDDSSLRKVDSGFQIRDYAEHQETRADVERRMANGAKGGKAKAAGSSGGSSKGSSGTTTTTNPSRPTESESESESETYLLNTVSQVSNAREKSTDSEEAIESSKRLAEGIGVDLDQVIKAAKRIDRHLTHSEALRLATFILQKAKRDPRNPNAYIAATFRDSWAEVQQWIDREAT